MLIIIHLPSISQARPLVALALCAQSLPGHTSVPLASDMIFFLSFLVLLMLCRALDSFKKLLHDKSHCLAHPDVLVSAVGTKIYNFTSESGWREDVGWSTQLNRGWNVATVRDAAYAALAKVSARSGLNNCTCFLMNSLLILAPAWSGVP